MWRSFPFFPSHSAGVDLEVGVCHLELPLDDVDPDGVYAEEGAAPSVWARGSEEEFYVCGTVLCHGAPTHRVPISTRTAASFDGRRCAFEFGELLRFPVKLRDLTRDAALAVTVMGEDRRVVASASTPLFDGRGRLARGLVKLALHDETAAGEAAAALAAANRATELGGAVGAFARELRGDEESRAGYGPYAADDHLFRAEKLRENFGGAAGAGAAPAAARPPATPERRASAAGAPGSAGGPAAPAPAAGRTAWLDAMTLERLGRRRAALEDREAWLRAVHTTAAERAMAGRAFLSLELPSLEHPVLYEEKPYAAAPTVPKIDKAFRDLRAGDDGALPRRGSGAGLGAAGAADDDVTVNVVEATLADMGITASSKHGSGGSLFDLYGASDGDAKPRREPRGPAARERRDVFVYDYEDAPRGGASNPIEDKYRALARDATRALVDRELKPNVDEARAIAKIVSAPGDALSPRDKELLWKFRYTLVTDKHALPKFLLSVDWRVEAELAQVRELLAAWRSRAPVDIADALKLLGPEKAFQHEVVRAFAVDALRAASDEELVAYLLQLVQALRYEARRDAALSEAAPAEASRGGKDVVEMERADGGRGAKKKGARSPLAAFLSERAARSLSVANFVWWYLKVGAEDASDEAACATYRVFRGRFAEDLATRAPDVYATLRAQEELVVSVLEAQSRAKEEKGRKDLKEEALRKSLSQLRVPRLVTARGVPMPLDPTVSVTGLHDPARAPKIYRSAMYPALVAFERKPEPPDAAALAARAAAPPPPPARARAAPPPAERKPRSSSLGGDGSFFDALATAAFGSDAGKDVVELEPAEGDRGSGDGGRGSGAAPPAPYRVIVKNGDDLRQDQLVLQFVLLMDLLLKRVNLDLKLTCYRALATGASSGLLQFVEDSAAISSILADHGGSITAFLRRWNPDRRAADGVSAEARDNFTRSCAGYCVITYLLGIGDRHLDNIMIAKDGRLFHIDFGFILGKDPKPYPPPFRLTKEMAEAMGYPDDPNYTQKFKTKCCQAYTCLRKHAPLLLNLMSLMKDAGIEHLSEESDVKLAKFQDRFRLDLSDEDAERFFLSLINESLNALVPVVLEKFHKIAVWMK